MFSNQVNLQLVRDVYSACGLDYYGLIRSRATALFDATRKEIVLASSKRSYAVGGHVLIIIKNLDEYIACCEDDKKLGYVLSILSYERAGHDNPTWGDIAAIVKFSLSGLYQDNSSPEMFSLWQEAFANTNRVSVVNQDALPVSATNVVYYCKTCNLHSAKYIAFERIPKNRREVKGLNVLYPYASPGDKAHTQLDLETAISSLCTKLDRNERKSILQALNLLFRILPISTYNSLATGLVVGSLAKMPITLYLGRLLEINACCLNSESLVLNLWSASNAIRRTHRLWDGRLADSQTITGLSYWHMCSTRQKHTSDWIKERRNRSTVIPLKNVLQYDFSTQCSAILSKLVGETMRGCKRPNATWADFVMRRQRHISSGSTGGVKTYINEQTYTAGKRVYFENTPTSEIIAWLDSKPKIVAKASEKYELGKARAIYGTKPIDFLIMAYVLEPLEERLDTVGSMQHKNLAPLSVQRINDRLQEVGHSNCYGLMVDYADFNIQHTLAIQSRLFSTIARYADSLAWGTDYSKAARWCADALLNCYAEYPDVEGVLPVLQGLFSGMRGTAIVNTLLNRAYYLTAADALRFFTQAPLPTISAYHQGDDVWLTSHSEILNIMIYHVLNAAGLRFEASKQNIAPKIGEFLRVWYDGQSARGFFARALASLIIRPLQSTGLADVLSKARESDSQIRVLIRRGLPIKIASKLWTAIVVYNFQSSFTDPRPSITDVMSALTLSTVFGGLGCPNPSTHRLSGRITRSYFPTPVMRTPRANIKETGAYMSSDLATTIEARYRHNLDISKFAGYLKRCNYANFEVDVAVANVCRKEYIVECLKWLRSINFKISHEIDSANSAEVEKSVPCLAVLLPRIRTDLEAVTRMLTGPCISKTRRRGGMLSDCIAAALSNSPFSSISEIIASTGANRKEAITILAMLCRNPDIGSQLSIGLQDLYANCGHDVASFWVEELYTMPAPLLNYLHPDIATTLHATVMDRIYTTTRLAGIGQAVDVRRICYYGESELIEYAKGCVILQRLSMY